MASGLSAGRVNNSGFKGGVDIASDDVLCSCEDSNGIHSDPVIGAKFYKDFHKNKVSRSSVFPTANAYTQPEDSFNQKVIITIEGTMKKHSDNLMRFLEGISSRLSQLELYCYNVDKSVGEMRSELERDHEEADATLKSLEKHLQVVQRSVQILRDKQEVAETQKELAKLQLVQKECLCTQQEEKVAKPASTSNKTEGLSEMNKLQLTLALPNQVASQASLLARGPEQQRSVTATLPLQIPPQTMTQRPSYYVPTTLLPNPAAQPQPSRGPYLPANSQYQAPQLVQNPSQAQADQTKLQQLPQYPQQWPQPVSLPCPQPPVHPAQPQSVQSQAQSRAPPSPVYAPYMPPEHTNPPQEALTSSTSMQVPLPGTTPQGVTHAEVVPYGYGVSGRPLQTQPPPQHLAPATHAPISSGGSYMIYDGEGSWSHHSPQTHFSQAGYNPANIPLPNPHLQPPTSAGLVIRGPSPPQLVRNHPYSELIDKLVSMGYRVDHVASIILRLEETGQPVDFNTVLDRLNGHSSGGSQRSW